MRLAQSRRLREFAVNINRHQIYPGDGQHWLQLSLKVVLQRILATVVNAAIGKDASLSASFLKLTPVRQGLCYRSPLGLSLAKQLGQSPNDWIPLWQQWFSQAVEPVMAAEHLGPFLTWTIQESGWLTMQLAAAGVNGWLQQLNDWRSRIPSVIRLSSDGRPLDNVPEIACATCDRLQISRPVLLHHAHTRCCRWLEQGPVAGAKQDAQASADPWRLQGHQPHASSLTSAQQQFLQAIVHALDEAATRPHCPRTCWRQGLRLSQAIAEFQAQVPLHGDLNATDPGTTLWLIRAAQQGLRAIAQDALGMSLVSEM